MRRCSRLTDSLLAITLAVAACCCSLLATGTARAADLPLHQRIDTLIEARHQGPASELTTDAEFLRRASLDLLGRIPRADEVREFLADRSAEKRAQAIDRLLASPEHPARMADFLHVMLMERQGDAPEWRKYLADSVAANKPWDKMVRDMIHADPADESVRGAAFFFTKRLENYGQNPVDVPGMVRDVGRLFLGVDVQCAQCHDHLFVKDYTQDYYQGLFAFVGQAQIRRDLKFPALAEAPLKKKVEFTSVFVKEPRAIGPKLPGGKEFDVPEMKPDEQFQVPPDRKTNFPGVPRFSTLKLLAEQLPTAENRAFARNMVNRLWWFAMGRGLVHPLDLHHSENPPSHPELLDLLAAEFTAHHFDVRWLLGELTRTRAYQRSSRIPEGVAADSVPEDSYRTALEKPLSSEQWTASVAEAAGVAARERQSVEAWEKLRERFAKAFANPPKEPETEFAPSVKAALFLMNDPVVLGWFQPANGNLAERLAGIPESERAVDELYLAVLSRTPDADERLEAVQMLAKHADKRSAALGRLAWALLTSTEFSVNH
ncbi:MAG: hypothetical protein RLY70_4585 [Planctomycetota bacterium]|jgi:hypothetical protein